MRVSCVICEELLQAQDVTATPCGHTFHARCITQWIQRDRSCPQCRARTTQRSLNKLYFDSNDAEDEPDPGILQQEIDNLKFEVTIKDQEVKKCSDDNVALRIQAELYQEDFKASQASIQTRDNTIQHLQTQIQHYMLLNVQVSEEAKKAKSDITGLREGVERLKDELSKVLDARESLRVELLDTTTKYEEAMQLGKGLKEEMGVILNTTVRHLKEENEYLEQENDSLEYENDTLKKKIRKLEQAVGSSSDVSRSVCDPDPDKCQDNSDSCHSDSTEVITVSTSPQQCQFCRQHFRYPFRCNSLVLRQRKRPRVTSESQEESESETIDLATATQDDQEQERSDEVEVIDLVTAAQEVEEDGLCEVEIIERVAAPPPKKYWMKKTLSDAIWKERGA